MELKVGMTYQYSSIATPERSARAMGSGGLPYLRRRRWLQ